MNEITNSRLCASMIQFVYMNEEKFHMMGLWLTVATSVSRETRKNANINIYL